ncbi:MAG TPA: PRC-barrel domain-containing protein [Stellaceae bacterium]|nr:PRC-barrel domain-containing protein [Stellaceae bacterium]
MRKTTMTAALAVLLAASPMAFAATAAATNTGATTTAPADTAVTSTRIQAGQILATDLNGADVYDQQDQKVSTVKDIILDHNGGVAAVVLDVAGRNVGVPMHALHIAMNANNRISKVTIDRSRNQLKSAEAFRLTRPGTGSGGSLPAGGTNR